MDIQSRRRVIVFFNEVKQMKIKIKDYEYEILEVDKDGVELKGQSLGLTKYEDNKIFLDKDMEYNRKRSVLKHELFHAFIDAYGHYFDNGLVFTCEHVCEIGATFSEDILEIVNKYFSKVSDNNGK